jgi:hypothetical protein
VHQGFGFVNVELIDNKNPTRLGVSVESLTDVVCEVLFSTSSTNRSGNYLTLGNMPIGNQSLSTMSNVLELMARALVRVSSVQ